MKKQNNDIIRGTITLVIAGLLTRFLGFYYRIFLSAKIGAEGIGLYQMIFPLFGLCMSISVSGVHTSVSKYVSAKENCSLKTLVSGLIISVPLSLFCTSIMFFGSDIIATYFLNEPRCGILLKYASVSIPMAVIHSCISGYFLGKKNALIPGITQFMEQLSRVACIWIIFYLAKDRLSGDIVSLAIIATIGLIVGEVVSMIISLIATVYDKPTGIKLSPPSLCSVKESTMPIFRMAFPLTMTNVLLSIVHSIEATAIPFFLNKYGLSYSDAISIYGILTAMSMPFILFPTTISGAVSKMLLPTIALAQSKNDTARISSLSMRTLKYSISFGLFCTAFFILTGTSIGQTLFHNETAGNFITILAWLCPLMFVSGTFASILHGLGLTKTTFFQDIAGATVKLAFIIFFIPIYGIKGYLWGILASELLCAILHTYSVLNYLYRT